MSISPEYNGSDAEVPFLTHERVGASKQGEGEKQNNRVARYVNPALNRIKVTWMWVWSNILTHGQFWMAAATVVMAISTVVYTRYSWRQWKALSDEIPITRRAAEAAEKSATASANQAETSKTSFQSTIDNFHVDQRAWVGQRDFRQPTFAAGENFVVSLSVSNSGKTPAIGLTMQLQVDPRPRGSKPNFEKLPPLDSRGVLQPNATDWIEINPVVDSFLVAQPLTKSDYDDVKSGRTVVWIYGVIRYSDVFEYRHWTTFCYTFNPNRVSYQMCRDNNDQDKEYR